jgi:hypothetical protein
MKNSVVVSAAALFTFLLSSVAFAADAKSLSRTACEMQIALGTNAWNVARRLVMDEPEMAQKITVMKAIAKMPTQADLELASAVQISHKRLTESNNLMTNLPGTLSVDDGPILKMEYALAYKMKDQTGPDLVILDVKMDGKEFAFYLGLTQAETEHYCKLSLDRVVAIATSKKLGVKGKYYDIAEGYLIHEMKLPKTCQQYLKKDETSSEGVSDSRSFKLDPAADATADLAPTRSAPAI